MLGIVLRHMPTVEARTKEMLNRDKYLTWQDINFEIISLFWSKKVFITYLANHDLCGFSNVSQRILWYSASLPWHGGATISFEMPKWRNLSKILDNLGFLLELVLLCLRLHKFLLRRELLLAAEFHPDLVNLNLNQIIYNENGVMLLSFIQRYLNLTTFPPASIPDPHQSPWHTIPDANFNQIAWFNRHAERTDLWVKLTYNVWIEFMYRSILFVGWIESRRIILFVDCIDGQKQTSIMWRRSVR